MKKITRIFLLTLLTFTLSGCRFIMDIIKPNENTPEEQYSITFDLYYNNEKSNRTNTVELKHQTAAENTENKLTILEDAEIRVSYILEDGKIISTTAIYEFTMNRDYYFEIFIVDRDKFSFVALDAEDNYLGALIFEKNHPISLEETKDLIPVLNIPADHVFKSWNQELPSVLNSDLFVKAITSPAEEPINAEVTLSKDYVISGDNVKFTANLTILLDDTEVVEHGFITLQTEYFVNELTLNNIFAEKVNVGSFDSPTFTIEKSKELLSSLNVRAYAIVKNSSGTSLTIYSDYIHTPYLYANELFFANYVEGATGYDKAVGIFNGTGEDVNLANYKVNIYSNGSTSSRSIALSGILPHGETYLVVHGDLLIDDIVQKINTNKIYGITNKNLNHNGNDAIELVKGNQPIDIIGTIGDDGFFGAGVTYIRKSTISEGNINSTIVNPFSFENGEWMKIDQLTTADVLTQHQVDLLGYDHKYYQHLLSDVNSELSYIILNLNDRNISSDLNLFETSYLHPNVIYKWTSSHQDIITNDGKYLYPISDSVVSFSVQMIVNGEPQDIVQAFEINVLSHNHQLIISADFNKQSENWDSDASKMGSLNKGEYLQSPTFAINNNIKLIIEAITAEGNLKVTYFNGNEAINQEQIVLKNHQNFYILMITTTEIDNIKFELLDGFIEIATIRILEEPVDNKADYQAPIIFANIPMRILKGSAVNLDDCYAIDNIDGKLNCEVVSSDLDVNAIGTYKIILYAIDSSDNAATLEIIITVYHDGIYPKLEIDPSEVLVKYIDLGKFYLNSDGEQGESIYIKIGDIDILVDAGMPYSNTQKAIDEVLQNNVTGQLDYIIATHPDQDHIGSFPYIFENYDVSMAIVYSTTVKNETQTIRNFQAALDNEPGLDVCEITDNINGNPNKDYCLNEYQLAPSVTMTFIDTNYLTSDKSNDSSIVFVLEAFGTKILLNGDAEKDQEQVFAPKVGKVDIFKLGHHGTRNATTEFLLQHLDPEVAIVTHGNILGNKHGHPTFEAINRLYQFNSKIKLFTPAGGGSEADECKIEGPSYKCKANNPSYQRNGTITVQVTRNKYTITSENYGNNILEFSSLTYWQNHPERRYSYTG